MKVSADEAPTQYRMDATNNTRKMGRGVAGLSQARRTVSKYNSYNLCQLTSVNVYVGINCLFFIADLHTQCHSNHPMKRAREQKSILSITQTEKIRTMALAQPNQLSLMKAAGKLHSGIADTQLIPSRSTMRTIGNDGRLKVSENETVEYSNPCDSMSVIKYLQNYKCRVLTLVKPVKTESLRMALDGIEVHDKGHPDPNDGMDHNQFSPHTLVSTSSEFVMETDISQWVEEYGPSKQEKNNNNGHAVCISWCLEDQYLLTVAFGHTIHIDATHKVTNISNLMLLTISIRDRFGKAYVIARFWIPNQKRWLFRYIMMDTFPKLLGSKCCQLVKAIVCDGDAQLEEAIYNAIDSLVFPNAIHRPCTWHISNRSIRSERRQWSVKHGISQFFHEWFCRYLQRWLDSFMIPGRGIENEDEYIVSKCILLGVINGPVLAKLFTADSISNMNTFLHNRIFTHEHKYVAYKYHKLFNQEQHSNSAHEGTNNGLKHSNDGLHRNDSLLSSTAKVTSYDATILRERSANIAREFQGKKLFTDNFCELTTHVVKILCYEESRSNEFQSGLDMCDDTQTIKWYVLYDYDQTFTSNSADVPKKLVDECLPLTKIKKKSTYELRAHMPDAERDITGDSKLQIPRMVHTRVVHVSIRNNEMYLFCSCGKDDRTGLICRHKRHIWKKYLKDMGFKPFNHRSVHCINYTAYAYIASKSETDRSEFEKHVFKKYQDRVLQGFTGTLCEHKHIAAFDQKIIFELFKPKRDQSIMPTFKNVRLDDWSKIGASRRILNFSEEFVDNCIRKYSGKIYDAANLLHNFPSIFRQSDENFFNSPALFLSRHSFISWMSCFSSSVPFVYVNLLLVTNPF